MRLVDIAYRHGLYRYYVIGLDARAILETLEVCDNLERLVQWAERKRLAKIKRYYIELLIEHKNKLLKYRFHCKHMMFWMEWVYCFKVMLFPPPQYYRRGAARKYQLR
jgi:hypothetical protein